MSGEAQIKHEAVLALTNPVEGKDAEFREWYWGTHIPEVLALPGFVAARRYQVPEAAVGAAQFRYATIYDVEGSAAEALNLLFTSGLSTSDTLDLSSVVMLPYLSED